MQEQSYITIPISVRNLCECIFVHNYVPNNDVAGSDRDF